MTGAGTVSGSTIRRLCDAIETAAGEADWTAVRELLGQRRQLLERRFARSTPADAARLRELAEELRAFDRQLLPRAGAARDAAAGRLKNLRRGREATEQYQRNTR